MGSDPASEQYVKNKILACQKLGIYSEKITPPVTSTTEDMLKVIEQINNNPRIDGVLVQMPLPKQIDPHRVLAALSPDKDADGFHPTNVGHLVAGRPAPRACTPSGIIEILKHYKVKLEGRKAVVLGRSDIVGKPMALMLLQENATVTICHSRTVNIEDECRTADILVTAMGKPAMVTSAFIAPGATVIDVGTTRISDHDEAVRLGKGDEFVKRGCVFVGDVNPDRRSSRRGSLYARPRRRRTSHHRHAALQYSYAGRAAPRHRGGRTSLRVGLTGGLASGKGFVGGILQELGCLLIRMDELGHQVELPGGEAYEGIVQEFGPEFLNEDKTINRRKLGAEVFEKPDRLEKLNALVHPAVRAKAASLEAQFLADTPNGITVTEAAILIESGSFRDFDRLILVVCGQEQQVERAMARDGLSREEVLSRIERQMPLEQKMKFANYIIDTSGAKEHAREQTKSVYERLRSLTQR